MVRWRTELFGYGVQQRPDTAQHARETKDDAPSNCNPPERRGQLTRIPLPESNDNANPSSKSPLLPIAKTQRHVIHHLKMEKHEKEGWSLLTE